MKDSFGNKIKVDDFLINFNDGGIIYIDFIVEIEHDIDSISYNFLSKRIMYYYEDNEGSWQLENDQFYIIYTPLIFKSLSRKLKNEINKGLKELYNEKKVKVFLRKQKLKNLN
jgi:hypothetical protein